MSIIGFWKVDDRYGFLSQWYSCNFKSHKKVFNSAEQYMMYKKAKLFHDREIAKKILETNDQKTVKRYGREIRNFDQKIWEENRCKIVIKGNKYKFTQNLDLLKKLLDTAPAKLVEASPLDNIWGCGSKDPNNPAPGSLNLLGIILTKLRDKLLKKLTKKRNEFRDKC